MWLRLGAGAGPGFPDTCYFGFRCVSPPVLEDLWDQPFWGAAMRLWT